LAHVFANRSENFEATEPRQENLYRNLPTASGETKDIGAGLTLMDGKLDIRATHINSSQINATSSTAVAGNRGISDYTAKLVGRYKFNNGRLKGFAVGANLRWESGKVPGCGRVPATFNFGGLQNYPGLINQLENEYCGDADVAGGMVVSYNRRIFNNKVNWRVQINAQELFSKQGLRVFAANGDGSPVYSIAPPRTFQLTNSFDL